MSFSLTDIEKTEKELGLFVEKPKGSKVTIALTEMRSDIVKSLKAYNKKNNKAPLTTTIIQSLSGSIAENLNIEPFNLGKNDKKNWIVSAAVLKKVLDKDSHLAGFRTREKKEGK